MTAKIAEADAGYHKLAISVAVCFLYCRFCNDCILTLHRISRSQIGACMVSAHYTPPPILLRSDFHPH
jgi:hypothetical protein